MMPHVQILLSTRDGELFLPDLLNSFDRQSYRNFSVIFRDDGSLDNSLSLIRCWEGKKNDVSDLTSSCGVVKSYETLLGYADSDYIMFADQDDVWHSDKIEKTLSKMLEMEAAYGKNKPLLIHTDLRICDEQLNVMYNSMWRMQSLNPRYAALKELMIQNNVTGCTVMINRTLMNLIRPFPPETICHDWYIALVVSAFGKISYVPESLIDYRQHSNNVFGAVSCCELCRKEKLKRSRLHQRLVLTQHQATAFAQQYKDMLSKSQLQMLNAWGQCEKESGYCKRMQTILRYGFRKNNLFRNLGMWWAI